MADKATDGLPYGQLGRAIFDTEHNEWRFGRSTDIRVGLQFVVEPKVISDVRTTATRSHPGHGDKDWPSRRRDKQAKALVHSLPELQPALDRLPRFAAVSEAIEDAVSQHDSSNGQLVTLGEIYDERRRDYVGAIAFPCGLARSDLRIVQGIKHRQGWDEDRSCWIETLDFSGESGTWTGPGVSILSVVFAQPLERGERYLAVRLQAETLIFRPTLRKHVIRGSSRLEPNLLFSVSIEDIGGLPHAHVAFNPWFSGQTAIVDQSGSWSIWETGRKSSTPRKLKSAPFGDGVKREAKRLHDDGWARVMWVESASTLCVATRQKLSLIDLEAVDELHPTSLELRSKRTLDWILDVGIVADVPDHLLVLTSSHIQVYRIEKDSSGKPHAKMVLRLRHHRSSEDISLRMSIGSSGAGTSSRPRMIPMVLTIHSGGPDLAFCAKSSGEPVSFQRRRFKLRFNAASKGPLLCTRTYSTRRVGCTSRVSGLHRQGRQCRQLFIFEGILSLLLAWQRSGSVASTLQHGLQVL